MPQLPCPDLRISNRTLWWLHSRLAELMIVSPRYFVMVSDPA